MPFFCVFLCCGWLSCVHLVGVINKIIRQHVYVLLNFFLDLVACREPVSTNNNNNNNNHNNNNHLQLGCHPVAVVILHVHKYKISN